MKLVPLILVLTAVLTVRADGNPYRFPVRVVNDERVNLLPLFAWWSNATEHAEHEKSQPPSEKATSSADVLPSRPLPKWVHVKTDNWKTQNFGWIMEAEVERSPGVSMTVPIFLKHPPLADKARFDNLVARRAWLSDYDKNQSPAANKRAVDASASARLQKSYTELANIEYAKGHYRGDMRQSTNTDAGKERQAMNDAGRAPQRAARAVSELQAIRVQLAAYQMGTYKIDLFAVFTGQYSGGFPVFDFGSIY